jgi:hypothetical protein
MPPAPKKAKLHVESHWISSGIDGGICFLPEGPKVYLAFRGLRDIHRGHEKSISAAMCNGSACWGLDTRTISSLRSQGVKWVCVLVRRRGYRLLAPLASFSDTSKVRLFDRPRRNRELQRFLQDRQSKQISVGASPQTLPILMPHTPSG